MNIQQATKKALEEHKHIQRRAQNQLTVGIVVWCGIRRKWNTVHVGIRKQKI